MRYGLLGLPSAGQTAVDALQVPRDKGYLGRQHLPDKSGAIIGADVLGGCRFAEDDFHHHGHWRHA